MALQILEAGVPAIITLNFVEDAEKKGIKIDYGKLEKLLGIPVTPINPLNKKGINKIIDIILKIKQIVKQKFEVRYDDDIEKSINKISTQIKGKLPKRFISLRVLEEDEDFYGYLKDKKIIGKAKENLKNHPKVAEDISITRYGTASFIAKKVTQITPLEKGKKIEEKLDKIFLHKLWGPFTTVLFLLIIFGILLYLGNFMQGILMGLTENLLSSFTVTDQSIVNMILVQGLTGLAAGVSIALPYVFLFYLILGLLEDVGLLSRFIVNAERFLKKLGLPGKSFIPLILGLGCTAPACRACRVLSSRKEQFHT
ncbi:unnamed protein product, partial [marine sediment metagenome]